MQYELRTQVVEPTRKTFTHLIDRYGDRLATRYEEGTVDLQATEHYHYRPLWDPSHEIYDEGFSSFKLTDPYSFTDPRQYYYAPYVTSRATMADAFASTLDYLDQRSMLQRLPQTWQDLIADLLLPLRHYESGAQMICCQGTRFAYGATIAACAGFAAFDRIGNAQSISRIGIALAGGTADLLAEAKTTWLDSETMQPLRRAIEELLVEPDWAVALIGLDTIDRLMFALLYEHLDDAAIAAGAGTYSLLAQHQASWFVDQRKWIDALYAAWCADPEHGGTNKAQLAAAVETALVTARDGVGALAERADHLVSGDSAAAVETTAGSVRDAVKALTA
ncbi:MAG: hypothetical protein ACK5MP_02160 [Nostocoides sp.]